MIRRFGLGEILLPLVVFLSLLLFLPTSARTQVQQASVDQLVHRDGFTWRMADTEHFRIYCEPGTAAEKQLPELTEQAEHYFSRVLELLGEPSSSMRIHVFLVGSRMRMKDLIGFETNGAAFLETLVLCNIVSDEFSSFNTHEMMHLASRTLWGSGKRWPERWINEGLAVYAGDHWHRHPLHALAKDLRLNKKLVPLRALIGDFEKYPDMVSYPESGSLVKYIFERHGRAKLKQLWKGGKSALHATLGLGLSSLQREWIEEVEAADATGIAYESE